MITRDLHSYIGLFISPFVVLFALSVFVLVHPATVGREPSMYSKTRFLGQVPLPANLESTSGRTRVDAIRPVLDRLNIHGEIGFIGYDPKEHRLRIPVGVPGRETTLDIDLNART